MCQTHNAGRFPLYDPSGVRHRILRGAGLLERGQEPGQDEGAAGGLARRVHPQGTGTASSNSKGADCLFVHALPSTDDSPGSAQFITRARKTSHT